MLEIFCGFLFSLCFFLAFFSFYRHTIETNRLDYKKMREALFCFANIFFTAS